MKVKTKLQGLFDRFCIELGSDPHANRRYFAELAVAYSFLALLLYVVSTLLAPLLIASENAFLRGIAAFSYIINIYMCHQMPERSFFLFGEPLGLCERCIAIFLAALIAFPAGALSKRFPAFMNTWYFVVLSLIPIAVDGGTQFLGWRESTDIERFSTGFIAAFGVVFYLVASVMERFGTGKTFYRKGIAVPVAIPFAMLVVPLLLASLFIGMNYKSAGYALEKAEELSPGAAHYEAHYIPPHATQSVRADSFLSSYSDPILRDLNTKSEFWTRGLGVWAALALNSTPERYGNYAYLSKGSGDYYYFDAWTGELIVNTTH